MKDFYILRHEHGPFSALCIILAICLVNDCGNKMIPAHQARISDTARQVCESPTGSTDPRCVGYFATKE